MWKDQNVRLVAVFIAGILVGAGGIWLNNRPIINDATTTAADSEKPATTDIAASKIIENDGSVQTIAQAPSLRVEDQNPGGIVTVTQAVLEKPAWVVIHDYNDGKPGNVLGARLFDKGRNSGIVQLLRATVVGHKYIAVVHTYSGAKRPFDSKIDLPMKTASGDMVTYTFSVTKAID